MGTDTAIRYVPAGYLNAGTGTVPQDFRVGRDTTFSRLEALGLAGVGVADVTYTLRKNGAAVAATALVMSNLATTASVTFSPVTWLKGVDTIGLQVTRSVTVATAQSEMFVSAGDS